jgi:hypothetical protein
MWARYIHNYWVLVFVHRPIFQKLRVHNVSETGSVSVLRGVGDTHSVGSLRDSHSIVQFLRLTLSKGPKRASVFPLTRGRKRI